LDRRAADLALARAAKRGDSDAVQRFMERMRCVPRILAALNRRTGRSLGPDELDDLAQDALAAVWAKLGAFEGHSALESWVYRFCLFELMNAVRRKRREPASPAALDEAIVPAARTAAEIGLAETVERALERIGPPAADVFRMKYFQGLTLEEIAARLGRSSNTVKSWYYRGLEDLRAFLEPALHEARPR